MTSRKAAKTEAVSLQRSKPTEQSLAEEAATLASFDFEPVSASVTALITDAAELLAARTDAEDLVSRGYDASDGLFERVKILMNALVPTVAKRERAFEARKADTAAALEAYEKILDARDRIALIGRAAGLPAKLFSVRRWSKRSDVLTRLSEIIENVKAHRAQMPDRNEVDASVTEMTTLLAVAMSSSGEEVKGVTGTTQQYKRLLLDTLRHLSRQGLAAYSRSPSRQLPYRLDQINRRSSKKKATTADESVNPVG